MLTGNVHLKLSVSQIADAGTRSHLRAYLSIYTLIKLDTAQINCTNNRFHHNISYSYSTTIDVVPAIGHLHYFLCLHDTDRFISFDRYRIEVVSGLQTITIKTRNESSSFTHVPFGVSYVGSSVLYLFWIFASVRQSSKTRSPRTWITGNLP